MSFGLKTLECVFEEGNKAYIIILCIFVYSCLSYVSIYILSRNFPRASWLLKFCKNRVLGRE